MKNLIFCLLFLSSVCEANIVAGQIKGKVASFDKTTVVLIQDKSKLKIPRELIADKKIVSGMLVSTIALTPKQMLELIAK